MMATSIYLRIMLIAVLIYIHRTIEFYAPPEVIVYHDKGAAIDVDDRRSSRRWI